MLLIDCWLKIAEYRNRIDLESNKNKMTALGVLQIAPSGLMLIDIDV